MAAFVALSLCLYSVPVQAAKPKRGDESRLRSLKNTAPVPRIFAKLRLFSPLGSRLQLRESWTFGNRFEGPSNRPLRLYDAYQPVKLRVLSATTPVLAGPAYAPLANFNPGSSPSTQKTMPLSRNTRMRVAQSNYRRVVAGQVLMALGFVGIVVGTVGLVVVGQSIDEYQTLKKVAPRTPDQEKRWNRAKKQRKVGFSLAIGGYAAALVSLITGPILVASGRRREAQRRVSQPPPAYSR